MRNLFLNIPKVLFFIIVSTALSSTTFAQSKKSHGLSAFGDLKYPADFKHFNYVNPEAPKGGRLTLIGPAGTNTFDSFNGYITKGIPAQGLGYLSSTLTLFDQLMVRAWDEPDAVYGLVAHSAEVAGDKRSVTFYMRPEAKFSDGSDLTAEDVVFTFETLKTKGRPNYAIALTDVSKATAIDKHTVKYEFKGSNIRDLPRVVATLPIFSKKYYSENQFDKTTLKPPLGSGPYKITNFKQGTFVTFKRRDDYWARNLPVNVGRFNFDELRYEYFRDHMIAFEALKAGKIDFREEYVSKMWATQYNFDALKKGLVVSEVLPDMNPSGAQGFFMNTRRDSLKDPKVRKAISLTMDFEWTNKNLFHSLYKRTHSYFENSPLKAKDLPSEAELKLLEPFKDQLPSSVFTEKAYSPPVSNASGSDRKLLRQASKLLSEAGWKIQKGIRTNSKGKKLKLEFLIYHPSFERIISPMINNLKKVGIEAKIRRVESAQFEQRVKAFDFDIVTQRFVMSQTPGVSLRNFLSSKTADALGSNNLSGIKSPVIDALIDKIIQSKNRQELTTATRALDRVLRAGHYWTPHWYKASHTIAYWNKFSKPELKPDFNRGVIETWWYDSKKASKTKTK